ncbi:hypothetical protein [Lacisediminihabitans profunda]|uniref:Uncharacterized protein n=1 Tax=Lacisediminihabitans profunda TaxID=2594790 RepID=A0A5C8UN24_9MICO|nr:hypothetical protein [Lacisediminihabitans profunda]TXN29812.1 hypothetical protein FVP33_11750 [Lacisediminihabitans profunda]
MLEAPHPDQLPQVIISIGDDNTITATMDGEMFLSGPIDRDLIGHVIGSIAEQHGGPIHVDIREVDGTSHTDIVSPPRPASPARPQPGRPLSLPDVAPAPELLEVVGEGFIPGEDVGVAVILRQNSARVDGRARGVVDRTEAPGGITDMILFGMISGTVVRGDHDS